MRILYVEDNATNVILVQRVASMGKHAVINYDDGQLALDQFDQVKPDLVLLDVQLRGKLTGLDIARILREKGCTLPILAVTAYAMKGDRQRCLDAGCDDYIAKPVSVAELVTIFKRYGDAVASGKPTMSTYKRPPAASPLTEPVVSGAAPVKLPEPPPADDVSKALVSAPVEAESPASATPTAASPLIEPVVSGAAAVNPPQPQPADDVSKVLVSAPVEVESAAPSTSPATAVPNVPPTNGVTIIAPPAASPQPEPLANEEPKPVSAEP